MRRLDQHPVPIGRHEIRLFAVVRNETVRLPCWLRHYRALGVDRFFVVDNGSTDGTVDLLLREPRVHLFQTRESFHEGNYGRIWMRGLMEEFGAGRWCVIADADELLAPPHWERATLHPLTRFLEKEGAEALPCLLLDVYGNGPIRDTVLEPDDDPLELCPYFDPDFDPTEGSFSQGDLRHPFSTFVGSTRRKAFGVQAYLSKIGMLRYRPGMTLTSGQHAVLGARESALRGVMFHLKFLSDFHARALEEMERDERRTHSHEWLAYVDALRADPSLTLFDARSEKLEDTRQLLRLGIMKTTGAYEDSILR